MKNILMSIDEIRKRLGISKAVALTITSILTLSILTGLTVFLMERSQNPQNTDFKAVTKTVYGFEEAGFQLDFNKERPFLYDETSFDVHKTTIPRNNITLDYNKMRFEVWYLNDTDKYVVQTIYQSPLNGNTINEVYLLRKKDGQFKIDYEESRGINLTEIKNKYQSKCFNCIEPILQ